MGSIKEGNCQDCQRKNTSKRREAQCCTTSIWFYSVNSSQSPRSKKKTPVKEEKPSVAPLPSGSIQLTLHKARDLEKKGKFGKADPYAILNIGKEKFKSSTVKNNHNPEWNYNMKFDINAETPDEVTLEVFDEDIGKDDALGQTTLSLREVVNHKKLVNKWIKLQQCKSGEVLFSAEYVPSDSCPVDSKKDDVTSESKQTKGVVEVKELLVKSKESVTVTDIKTKQSVTVTDVTVKKEHTQVSLPDGLVKITLHKARDLQKKG